MKRPEKLPAKLGGVLLSALLLAAAAAAGLYLTRAMAEYEDARQQHELGVYEMNAVSLGNHAEDDTGERMERVQEAFAYSFNLEKGLNLDAAEAAGYGEAFFAGLRQAGMIQDAAVLYASYVPQLKAQKDGRTMIVWQAHIEAVWEDGAEYRRYAIDQVMDDTTGAVLAFSIYCEYAGLVWENAWNGMECRQVAESVAEMVRQHNGFASVRVVEEEMRVQPDVDSAYYFQKYTARFTDRAGAVYEIAITVAPYNLTFNIL